MLQNKKNIILNQGRIQPGGGGDTGARALIPPAVTPSMGISVLFSNESINFYLVAVFITKGHIWEHMLEIQYKKMYGIPLTQVQ